MTANEYYKIYSYVVLTLISNEAQVNSQFKKNYICQKKKRNSDSRTVHQNYS